MEKEIVPALLGQGAGLQENAVDLHIPLLDLNSILRLEPVADNNEEGSLTPTTKTKKVQLGDIEVNNIDIGEYNKITRSEQNKMKQLLNKELNKLKVQIAACETAIDQKDDKTKLFQTCNASLITLKDELELSEGKLNEIMNSTFIYEVESDSNFSFATRIK